jgi:hypothetical protein
MNSAPHEASPPDKARAGWLERSETHRSVIHDFKMKFWRHEFDTVAMGFVALRPLRVESFSSIRK